jgi:hypothetical protein
MHNRVERLPETPSSIRHESRIYDLVAPLLLNGTARYSEGFQVNIGTELFDVAVKTWVDSNPTYGQPRFEYSLEVSSTDERTTHGEYDLKEWFLNSSSTLALAGKVFRGNRNPRVVPSRWQVTEGIPVPTQQALRATVTRVGNRHPMGESADLLRDEFGDMLANWTEEPTSTITDSHRLWGHSPTPSEESAMRHLYDETSEDQGDNQLSDEEPPEQVDTPESIRHADIRWRANAAMGLPYLTLPPDQWNHFTMYDQRPSYRLRRERWLNRATTRPYHPFNEGRIQHERFMRDNPDLSDQDAYDDDIDRHDYSGNEGSE